MKSFILAACLSLAAALANASAFNETWVYLMKGEEKFFPARSSITDVGCFSAGVDGDGHLTGGHMEPPALPGANPGTRYHLVITIPWSTTLAHIYLNPELPFRQRIIDGIVERCGPFDGVQIDIESVSSKDRANFLKFLVAVKKALPEDKIYSVAVMARWADHKKKNPADPFDYPFIGKLADRVIVMAYDEHYRGGSAGPIASLPWCREIYDYATATIPAERLVMGVPLYGRGWQKPSLAKAYKNREVVSELLAKNIQSTWDAEQGASYSFEETVTVNVHYETTQSISAKIGLYGTRPTQGVAFWRIGQEPEGLFEKLAR